MMRKAKLGFFRVKRLCKHFVRVFIWQIEQKWSNETYFMSILIKKKAELWKI